MQGQPISEIEGATGGQVSASADPLRFIPAPHSASEQAARDAAIVAKAPRRGLTRGRVLAGACLAAMAFAVPDFAVDAMNSPYFRIDVREPSPVMQQPIWSPSVGAPAPVYAPVIASEVIAPEALTYTSRSQFSRPDTDPLALEFLETGSRKFDLAFAGVELPRPVDFAISRGLPEQPAGLVKGVTSPIRTREIEVPQISGLPRLAANVEPRRPRRQLTAQSAVARSNAVANESVAAAFAGAFEVSADVRSSVPINSAPVPSRRSAVNRPVAPLPTAPRPNAPQPNAPQPNAPVPDRDDTARAVPIPVPEVTTSARDLQTELVTKTRLDARINGVVTGKVDFRQLDGTIAIRLGSVVDMLRNRYDANELDALAGSGALDSFVTLAQLQSAGIPISYDPVYDEVEFGIDYDDAPQAVKVQVEQIGPPTFTSEAALIDQIPR